jgi:hypothetical protein
MIIRLGSIYALIDPFTLETHYVGQTIYSLDKRLWYHFREEKKHNYQKYDWLKSLKKQKAKPIIKCLLTLPEDELNEAEIEVIAYFRWLGYPLFNLADGWESCGSIQQGVGE